MKILLDEPVSLFETLRTLLILRCLPPVTAKEALPALQKSIEGSAGSRVARDFLAGLPRDTSFVSRVFYRAQDHEKEFDLSLFTYAPHLLQREPKKPDTGLSVQDASELLASGLLNLLVHETVLTPQQAEQKAGDLSVALKRAFLEGSDLASARTKLLTRRMLLQFLSTVILRPDADASAPALGEVWWKRIEG